MLEKKNLQLSFCQRIILPPRWFKECIVMVSSVRSCIAFPFERLSELVLSPKVLCSCVIWSKWFPQDELEVSIHIFGEVVGKQKAGRGHLGEMPNRRRANRLSERNEEFF